MSRYLCSKPNDTLGGRASTVHLTRNSPPKYSINNEHIYDCSETIQRSRGNIPIFRSRTSIVGYTLHRSCPEPVARTPWQSRILMLVPGDCACCASTLTSRSLEVSKSRSRQVLVLSHLFTVCLPRRFISKHLPRDYLTFSSSVGNFPSHSTLIVGESHHLCND